MVVFAVLGRLDSILLNIKRYINTPKDSFFMKRISSKIFFLSLMMIMLLIKLFDLIFNPNKIFPGRIASFPFIELVMVGILGVLGLLMYKRLGFPDFETVLGRPILLTVSLGLLFSLFLALIDSFAVIGNLSVGYPLSILFYTWGAISTEIILKLFLITFLVWLISIVVFRRKYQEPVFWICAVLASFLVTFGMLGVISNLETPVAPFFLFLIGLIVFSSEIVSFKLFKELGFLSSLIFRFSFYLIWHILWPLVFYG